ncbi:DoxX family protein [Mangrovicella endophytica]|uniref:DoxX family protein n=1 Tax=Mangrovicella endophytica TaxID=2066697 RepID=UPI000C9E011E|nr:DoxX family protein [Mangrovicella endophytica]
MQLNTWQPRVLSVLRIVSALLFLQHGTQKILGFPASERGMPELMSLAGAAGLIELIGGALLLIGLFSRPAAFIMSGQMAVAYWMAHAPSSPFPIINQGDSAILYCFVFLYIVFAGPGPWSVDAARGRA